MIVTHNNSPVGVAEDYLCTHVYELIYKEQSALKHLLVEEHAALCLRSHHEEHAEQVGGESRPRCVAQGHDGTVDERVYLVRIVMRYHEGIALLYDGDAEASKGIGDDAEVAD